MEVPEGGPFLSSPRPEEARNLAPQWNRRADECKATGPGRAAEPRRRATAGPRSQEPPRRMAGGPRSPAGRRRRGRRKDGRRCASAGKGRAFPAFRTGTGGTQLRASAQKTPDFPDLQPISREPRARRCRRLLPRRVCGYRKPRKSGGAACGKFLLRPALLQSGCVQTPEPSTRNAAAPMGRRRFACGIQKRERSSLGLRIRLVRSSQGIRRSIHMLIRFT